MTKNQENKKSVLNASISFDQWGVDISNSCCFLLFKNLNNSNWNYRWRALQFKVKKEQKTELSREKVFCFSYLQSENIKKCRAQNVLALWLLCDRNVYSQNYDFKLCSYFVWVYVFSFNSKQKPKMKPKWESWCECRRCLKMKPKNGKSFVIIYFVCVCVWLSFFEWFFANSNWI